MQRTPIAAALLVLSSFGAIAQQTNVTASMLQPVLMTNAAPGTGVTTYINAQTNRSVIIPAGLTNPAALRPISLAEAVQMALGHNFDVQIRRYDPEISKYRLNASYAVYEPALGLSGAHSVNESPGGFDQFGVPSPSTTIREDAFAGGIGQGVRGYLPSGLTYGVTSYVNHREQSNGSFNAEQYGSGWLLNMDQPLLRNAWIDAERATIMINKKNLQISEWSLRDQFIQSIAQVESDYYDLIVFRELVQVQRTVLEANNQLLRENKKRVEVGAMAPLDEKSAESEVAKSVADLIQAEQNYAIQQNVLKNHITDQFEKWVDITLDPVENLVAVPADTDLAESWKRGLNMRPDIQQLKLDLESRDINLKYLKNQMWPALDLTGSYGETDLKHGYHDAWRALSRDDNPRYSYGLAMSIPLGNTGPRNNYKESLASKKQALTRYKQLEQTIMVQIDTAIKFARSQFQQVDATRQARLFAEDALHAEQKKLENGKSTSYEVLLKQRDVTQRRYDEIFALGNYNKALSAIARQEGATLQRNGIGVTLR
jgi:outer membrane protein TolC